MSEVKHWLPSVGQVFHDRYEIVECLKKGGMGAVYECIHRVTRKRCALKVMLPQLVCTARARERFELEARVTAEIESEHVVEIFDAGVDEATGAPFLVMELLRGEDLRVLVKRRGPLPGEEVVLLLSQAALALDRMHAAGIVHRDLKPENLFVTTRDDGTPRLKILDFGIAKVVVAGDEAMQHTASIGTPLYMPREQIQGEGVIGPQADVYALGHIAFTLLTGKAYWAEERKAAQVLYAFLWQVLEGLPEAATARAARRGVTLPAAFDAWFARATALEAAERFETASALSVELAAILGQPEPRPASRSTLPPSRSTPSSFVVPRPEGAGTPGAEPTGAPVRPWLPWTLTAAVAAAATTFGALLALGPGHGRSHATLPPSAAALTVTDAGAPPSAPAIAPRAAPAAPPATAPAVISTAPSPGPAAPRKPAPRRAAAPAETCEPPYVIDGDGHRRIKPECL